MNFILKGFKDNFYHLGGNICKTSLYDGISFPEGRIFEDTATMYKLWYKVKKVACLDKHYYHYVRNPNSITQTSFNSKGRFDYLLGNEERLNFAQMGGGGENCHIVKEMC